ncbi:unnamed protein product [Brassica oleracea]
MACALRSFSRRNLSPKWFSKISSTSPPSCSSPYQRLY